MIIRNGGGGMAFIPQEYSMSYAFQPLPPLEDHPTHLCASHDFDGIMMWSLSSGCQVVDQQQGGGGGGDHVDDDMSDDYGCPLGEKKRRLNMEQVKALEKSFELGNKLEPERKLQLARALGLQPRQIAIWFQNRRARWKTKQLERDYDVLKKQFDSLQAHNHALKAHNHKLHSQLLSLKSGESSARASEQLINLNTKDNEGTSRSNGSENSCIDVNLGATATVTTTSSDYHHHHRPPYHKNNGFPATTTSLTQLLQGSNKIDQDEGGYCNMFNGIGEQRQSFCPWPPAEQQHFP